MHEPIRDDRHMRHDLRRSLDLSQLADGEEEDEGVERRGQGQVQDASMIGTAARE